MNDMNEPNQTAPGTEHQVGSQAAGFCQHCGIPLNTDTIRRVGPAVYCEPCLAARLGAGPAGTEPGYRPVGYGARRTASGWPTNPVNTSVPNPGLAALLGLIPGVGAMYNEQYAKGVVHLVVFAVLVSFANHVSDIFGVLLFGWICYMAIEAHHTARARRDGTPLPNPFGLNDIGERLGFGKAWPSGPSVAEVAHDAARAAGGGFQGAAGSQPPPYQPAQPPPAGNWGAPQDAYAVSPADAAAAYKQRITNATHEQVYADLGYAAPTQQGQPFTTPYAPIPPYDPSAFVPALAPSRFPAGAVWLIALGVLFLLTTMGLFNTFPPEALVGCVVLGIGIWVFIRRMTETGTSFAGDGSPAYPLRLLRALRWSVWLALIGTLFLLDAFNILMWHYSWPFLIILPGVMAILERAAVQSVPNPYMPQPVTPVSTGPDHSGKGDH